VHSGTGTPRARGFTLVELMVVVSIAAVLAVIAVPSLQASIQANQLDTVSNQLLAALATARSEAVRTPSTSDLGQVVQVFNLAGAGVDWKGGWATTRQTTPVATGTTTITNLQSPTAVPGQVTVMSNFVSPVSFDAMGRLVVGAANPPPTLVWVICADGTTVAGKSRAVIVSPSGRASIAHIPTSGANAGIPILDSGVAIASCTPPRVL